MTGRRRRIVLFGGSSEIGLAIVRALIGAGEASVVLAGRPGPERRAAAEGLGAVARTVRVLDYDTRFGLPEVIAVLRRAAELIGPLDCVVVAVGRLHASDAGPGTGEDEATEPGLASLLQDNLTGPALIADAAAAVLRHQGRGTLLVVTSAAAVRPRDAVLGYSVAKQALDSLVTALDRRVRPHGVRCFVVRPGQVRTRMTAGLPDAPLTLDPDQVAARVVAALGRRSPVIWAPATMRLATTALRALPRRVLPIHLR